MPLVSFLTTSVCSQWVPRREIPRSLTGRHAIRKPETRRLESRGEVRTQAALPTTSHTHTYHSTFSPVHEVFPRLFPSSYYRAIFTVARSLVQIAETCRCRMDWKGREGKGMCSGMYEYRERCRRGTCSHKQSCNSRTYIVQVQTTSQMPSHPITGLTAAFRVYAGTNYSLL